VNETLRSVQAFLERGGYPITILLVLLSIALWTLVVERAVALGEAPWELVVPRLRRKRLLARALFQDAFGAYTAVPTLENEAQLLQRCESLRTPATVLVERFLAASRQVTLPLRELLGAKAALLGQREIEKRFLLLRQLLRAALLLGVLAAVSGLERSLTAMSSFCAHEESAWAEGLPRSLAGCQLAGMVLLPGLLGHLWLSYRAARARRELRIRHASLSRTLDGFLEVTSL
jgi:hypothetical protein